MLIEIHVQMLLRRCCAVRCLKPHLSFASLNALKLGLYSVNEQKASNRPVYYLRIHLRIKVYVSGQLTVSVPMVLKCWGGGGGGGPGGGRDRPKSLLLFLAQGEGGGGRK